MAEMRWFLLNTTHGGYASAIGDCGNRHVRNWPRNVLSIVLSDDGSLALVKSDSMSPQYRRGKWAERVKGGVMLAIYDKSTHHLAQELLRGPEWSNFNTPAPGIV